MSRSMIKGTNIVGSPLGDEFGGGTSFGDRCPEEGYKEDTISRNLSRTS